MSNSCEKLWKLAIQVHVYYLVSDTKRMTIDCTYTINYLQKYFFFLYIKSGFLKAISE